MRSRLIVSNALRGADALLITNVERGRQRDARGAQLAAIRVQAANMTLVGVHGRCDLPAERDGIVAEIGVDKRHDRLVVRRPVRRESHAMHQLRLTIAALARRQCIAQAADPNCERLVRALDRIEHSLELLGWQGAGYGEEEGSRGAA